MIEKTKNTERPKPRVIVLSGYGINCEEETKFAFDEAGARAEIVHINDLITKLRKLNDYQILAFPGGFSYGDDTGSGKAFANRVRRHLWDDTREFISRGKLMIGICNGFQIMVNLGLLPALNGKYGKTEAALLHNDKPRYHTRWVDLKFFGEGPWTSDICYMMLPIAHGEGKFYADSNIMSRIKEEHLIAAKYLPGEICRWQGLPANPNGSLEDIAGITDESGRLIGMMPHPERAVRFTQLPHWTWLKEKYSREGREIPKEADGIKIFRNGVRYVK